MNHLTGKFLLLTAFFVCLIAIKGNYLVNNWNDVHFITKGVIAFFILVQSIAAILSAMLGVVLPISKLHTFTSAIAHAGLMIYVYWLGYTCHKRFVKSTKQVRATQHQFLMDILAKNATTTLFGRDKGFVNIKSIEEYQKALPLTKYDDYRPYVDRMERGEENILTTAKLVKFAVSSGTTGKCKLLPFTNIMQDQWAYEFYVPLTFRWMSKSKLAFNNIAPVKEFLLSYVPNWRYTATGIPIGPVSAQHGKPSKLLDLLHSTPSTVLDYMSEPAQSYIHWLFAAMDDSIQLISCSFGGTLLVNFEFFQKNWRQIADDVRHGQVTNNCNIPHEVVQEIQKIIKPDPSRADEIEKACSKGSFEGVMKRLWPGLDSISAVCTGAHAIYRDRIMWYAGSGINLLSPFFGASEGIFGVPANDEQDKNYTYTLLLRMTFFEFIPEDKINEAEPPVFLVDQLKIGERYELVITSENGFYRYRMGDIVKVVGYYNEAPVVEFCSRTGGILDLRGEKTTEDMLDTAVNTAVSKWPECRQLAEYTATDCMTFEKSLGGDEAASSGTLYYALFLELDGISRPLADAEEAAFDEALASVSFPYKSMRSRNAISKPKVFVVRHGTFEELKRRILESNNAVSNQFKWPRYQKKPEFVRFLIDCAFTN